MGFALVLVGLDHSVASAEVKRAKWGDLDSCREAEVVASWWRPDAMKEPTFYLTRFSQLAEAQGFTGRELVVMAGGPVMVWERLADGPRIYVSSGMHGDEPAGPAAMLALLEAGFFRADVHWLLCPLINPDGMMIGTRENARGVDLNRDYLKRSSDEVRAHAGWLESMPAPDLFLSLHEDCDTSGFYFYEINLGEDRPERAAAIIAAVSPIIEAESGDEIDGHEPRGPGWIHHVAEADEPEGWPEAIFLAKHGCPLSFTFETPSQLALSARVAAQMEAVKSAVVCVLDRE